MESEYVNWGGWDGIGGVEDGGVVSDLQQLLI